VLRSALAYLLGNMTVYTLVSSAIILTGLQLEQMVILVIVTARKRTTWAITEGRPYVSMSGAYWLGAGLVFALCPTLFWLFFGVLIPLAIALTGGLVFSEVFALGTTLPLLFFAGLNPLGVNRVGRIVAQVKPLDPLQRRHVFRRKWSPLIPMNRLRVSTSAGVRCVWNSRKDQLSGSCYGRRQPHAWPICARSVAST
jgi:hypothetical protein